GPAAGNPVPGEPGVAGLVPFGLDRGGPAALFDGFAAAFDNRGALSLAWRILRDGGCDGCGLAQRGLIDDVVGGPHLCRARVRSLRHDTASPFAPVDVADLERLRGLDDPALRSLGRVPYPFVARPGERGFARVRWDE